MLHGAEAHCVPLAELERVVLHFQLPECGDYNDVRHLWSFK